MDQYSIIYLVDSPLLPVHVFITMLQSVRHMSKYLSLRHSYSKCSSLDTHHSSVYCSFCNRRSLHDIIKKVGPFKHASPFANPFCSLTKEVKSSLQKERSTTRVNFFLDKLFVSTLISAIMWDATKCHKNKRILFPILFFWNRKTNLCSHLSKR